MNDFSSSSPSSSSSLLLLLPSNYIFFFFHSFAHTHTFRNGKKCSNVEKCDMLVPASTEYMHGVRTQYLCIFSAVYPVPLYKSFQFPILFYHVHGMLRSQNWPLATALESLFFLLHFASSATFHTFGRKRRKKNSLSTERIALRWKLIINICME